MEKQIEELAKRICTVCDKECSHKGKCLLVDGVARYMYETEGYRKQEWISVDDRLPEIEGKYLISRKTVYGNLINIVWYDTNYDGGNDDMIGKSVWYMFDGDCGDYEIPNVTHWMPLPEPPKMKGEQTKKKHFSPEEVRNMTPKEVRENLAAIMKSMRKWK